MENIRSSSRKNKGVPPRRYPLTVAGDSCIREVQTEAVVHQEDNDLDTSPKRASISKSHSSATCVFKKAMSKLSLELELIEEQKKLDQEEAEERIRLINKKRQLLIKEKQIQKQIVDEQQSGYDDSVIDEIYVSPKRLNDWIHDARQCALSKSFHSSVALENDYGAEKSQLINDLHSVPSTSKNKDLLLDIAKQCVENTNATNTLLLRSKLKDLYQFSGELSEWPIFISEFKHTTQRYNLSNHENLVRLDRSLKGKAREAVRSLLTSAVNVPTIIKILEMNFGRPEWIILSLMQKSRKLNPIREDKPESSILFLNTVSNMVTTIKNIGSECYLLNPELLSSLVEKLPSIQCYNWGKQKYKLESENKHVSLEDFSNWLHEEVNAIIAISNPFQRSGSIKPKQENVLLNNKKGASTSPPACSFCKSSLHAIKECAEFLEIPIAERRTAVMEKKLCFLCLKPGHSANKCYYNKKIRCNEQGCYGKHNKLLHIQRTPDQVNNTSDNTNPENLSQPVVRDRQHFCAKQSTPHRPEDLVLLKILPVILRGPGGEYETFALLDEGSTCSLIEADLADKLQLPGLQKPLCLKWTNEKYHYDDESRDVSLEIAGTFDLKFHKINKVRTLQNLKLPSQRLNIDSVIMKYPHMTREILETVRVANPQILLGQSHIGLIVSREVIQPQLNQPMMSLTKLGWTVHGPINYTENSIFEHVHLCCNQDKYEELDLLVRSSFRLDDFGLKSGDNVLKSLEDKRALEIMRTTLQKDGNHYVLGHLWKNKEETLPDSRENALRRFYCMERKMKADKKFAEEYSRKIQEYINKGYACKLDPCEIIDTPKTWYLPHFAVWNINKPGKLRFVFDAAAKSHGFSLNDFLLQGPNFVPSLIAVLFRFRQGIIAVNGDIKDMFHQVHIKEEDKCAQRFFWRELGAEHNPDVYQMNVMIFGAISSPSKAQFVKNTNAELHEDKFPGLKKLSRNAIMLTIIWVPLTLKAKP